MHGYMVVYVIIYMFVSCISVYVFAYPQARMVDILWSTWITTGAWQTFELELPDLVNIQKAIENGDLMEF